MRILEERIGFVTNSSSTNYWFVILSREDGEEEAVQILQKTYQSSLDEARKSVRLRGKLSFHWICEQFDPYFLNVKKFGEMDKNSRTRFVNAMKKLTQDVFDQVESSGITEIIIPFRNKYPSVIEELGEYSPREIGKFEKRASNEILEWCRALSNDELVEFLEQLHAISKVFFTYQRYALSKIVKDALIYIMKAKDWKLRIFSKSVGKGEFAIEFANKILRQLGYEDIIYYDWDNYHNTLKDLAGSNGILGIKNGIALQVDYEINTMPALSLLEDLKIKNFKVWSDTGATVPLSWILSFLNLNEEDIKESLQQKRKVTLRAANVLLGIKDFFLGTNDPCYYGYD